MVTKTGENLLYEDLTYQIRGAIFNVWKEFGGAFKEKVVDRALTEELKSRDLKVENQKSIDIYYKGKKIASYTPDKIVNNSILLEIKCKPYLTKEDERQFWLYLKGSKYKLGLLINFGSKKLEIKRRVYDKARQNFCVNPRNYQRLSTSIQKSFTLIEVLVSIFIIILLAGIIFANYRVGGQQFALQRSANKLAQDIRRAQQMAMAAKECPAGTGCAGQIPLGGYGIVLDLDPSWDPTPQKKYRLYADTNGDNEFFTPPDTIIEPIELEKGVIIKEISLPPDTYSSVSINFKPPDPSVTIKFNIGPPGQSEARITLALETDLNKTKTVKINKAGLIEIE